MSNLTITVDADVLKRARMRALEQGTSVNKVVRQYLESYAGAREAQLSAVRDLMDLSRSSDTHAQRRWTRDELHERRG
jgi:hypothetical protein